MSQTDSFSSLLFWPDWSWYEAATAIRTYVVQYVIHTVTAERTFVATDPCFGGVRWQVFITVFAVWAYF